MSMAVSGMGGAGGFGGVSGASMRMPPQQQFSNLFSMVDSSGTGSITKSQLSGFMDSAKTPAVFRNAGVDAVWSQLDPSNSGSVSKDQFVSTMTNLLPLLRNTEASASTANSASSSLSSTLGARYA